MVGFVLIDVRELLQVRGRRGIATAILAAGVAGDDPLAALVVWRYLSNTASFDWCVLSCQGSIQFATIFATVEDNLC